MKSVLIQLFFIVLASCFAIESHASDFRVTAPATWKKSYGDKNLSIYRNVRSTRRQTVTTQVLALDSAYDELNLRRRIEDISSARANLMQRFGLNGYYLLGVDKIPRENSRPSHYWSVRSYYRDFLGNRIETFERQFVIERKMWVVTYLTAAPSDEVNSEAVLDQFQPVYPKARNPASETFANSAGGSTQNSAAPMSTPDPKVSENVKRCRTADDMSFSRLLRSGVGLPTSCGWGWLLGVWGVATSGGSILRFIDRYTDMFSSNYRDQVNAMAGTILSEITSNGTEFFARVAEQIWNKAEETLGDFVHCKKPSEMITDVCYILSHLNPGLVLKIAAKVPLAASETMEFAAVARTALGRGKAVEETKLIENKPGLRVHEAPESGIKVTVRDQPPAPNTAAVIAGKSEKAEPKQSSEIGKTLAKPLANSATAYFGAGFLDPKDRFNSASLKMMAEKVPDLKKWMLAEHRGSYYPWSSILDDFKNLGPGFEQLVVDPVLVQNREAFLEFMTKNPGIKDPWRAREAYIASTPKVTVYRAMMLSDDDLKAVEAQGILANGVRGFEQYYRDHGTVPPGMMAGRREAMIQHTRKKTENSPFISVSKHPDLAIAVAQEHGDPSKQTYLFEIEVHQAELKRDYYVTADEWQHVVVTTPDGRKKSLELDDNIEQFLFLSTPPFTKKPVSGSYKFYRDRKDVDHPTYPGKSRKAP